MDEGKAKARGRRTPTRFFAYYRANDLDRLEGQRRSCHELVARSGGTIAEETADVGPGLTTGLPGYTRMYEALLKPDFEVLAIDMSEFGPSMLLGLSAVCTVSHVEFWDIKNGRVSKAEFEGIVELFKSRVDTADDELEAIRELMSPMKSLN